MIPTTLPPTLLPRSRGLTDALAAPAGPPPPPAAVAGLRGALRRDLEVAAAGAGGPVRVAGFALRAGSGVATGGDEPFRWTPRRARRALGVPAAGRVVDGRARTPAEAAEAELAAVVAAGGGARPGSLAAWLAAAPHAVAAIALAEATAWATHVLTAVEWHRVAGALVGGPDRWWDLPGPPGVGLRGRADVRLRVPPPRGAGAAGTPAGPPLSCLSLLGGRPGTGSRAELGLAALVEVMRRPEDPVPARVVGWWPECGRALVLPVDMALLAGTAAAAVGAVRRQALGRPAPSQPRGR